jgi:hypothetical protein
LDTSNQFHGREPKVRIHTNTLGQLDIQNAAYKAGAYITELSRHGSRTHDHAYEVKLSGESSWRQMGNRDEYAASWDQWGIFLAELYDRDDSMTMRPWGDVDRFHNLTFSRFETLTREQTHRRHKWEFSGVARVSECKCGARVEWA